MKFFTINTNHHSEFLIEVEINLIKGLPRFSIIGLPDAALKEGVLRLRSALISQGYEIPQNREIVINLKPAYSKKLNQNVEVAILICFLHMTNQIDLTKNFHKENLLVLGDVDLNGNVSCSLSESSSLLQTWSGDILTGETNSDQNFNSYNIKNISDLKNQNLNWRAKDIFTPKRPDLNEGLLWSTEEAKLLGLLSYGEFSALLAGPHGSGKTTIAKEMWKMLLPPFEANRSLWRPLISPHHTIPKISLIGGGVPLRQGELSKASGGVLLLDEFLEFKRESLEVLREAMANDEVEISRMGQSQKFKTDFITLATTNLCPCGKWTGRGEDFVSCSKTLQSCKSYRNKLIGPLVDRFEILWVKNYRKVKSAQKISSIEVLEQINKARQFCLTQNRSQLLNVKLELKEILPTLKQDWLMDIYSFSGISERRKLAFWRVARTLADLDLEEKINEGHLREAYDWTCLDFRTLS